MKEKKTPGSPQEEAAKIYQRAIAGRMEQLPLTRLKILADTAYYLSITSQGPAEFQIKRFSKRKREQLQQQMQDLDNEGLTLVYDLVQSLLKE